jgi:serine/threonine protein kinase
MAPEIVRRTEYEGKPVDMWSMGILLYALLCGCFPFRAKSYPDLYRRIARGTFAIPEELSVSVKDLLRQLLTVDVAQRITSHAALRHPWLQMQLATSPDVNKLRLETLILISDKPSDDIDEQTLAELEKFGIMRDEVIRLILTKTHSAIATLYYLLLEITVTKRRMQGKRSSGGSSGIKRAQSASASGRSSSSALAQNDGTTLPASLGYTYTGAVQQNRSGADVYLQQQQQQQQHRQQMASTGMAQGQGTQQAQGQGGQSGGSDGYTLLRPKSASATRPANSGPARPLSAFAGRR